MMKTFKLFRSTNLNFARRAFSSTEAVASQHKKEHLNTILDPRFYENDYLATNAKEFEFVRSPFYDLAKGQNMTPE